MPQIDYVVIETGLEATAAKLFTAIQLPRELGGLGLDKDAARVYIYNLLDNIAAKNYGASPDLLKGSTML